MSRRIQYRHCRQRRYKANSSNGENKPKATKTSETTTTLEKTGFMALPLELRLEIYQYLTEKPRIVAICYHRKTQTYTARTSPPAILGINRDSRREGQKIYKELALGGKSITGAYINVSRDNVYLSSFWGKGGGGEAEEFCRKICRDVADNSSGFGVGFEDLFENLIIQDEVWDLLRCFYKQNFFKKEYYIGMSRVVEVHEEEEDGPIPKNIKLVTPDHRVYKPIRTPMGIKKIDVEEPFGISHRILKIVQVEMATGGKAKSKAAKRGRALVLIITSAGTFGCNILKGHIAQIHMYQREEREQTYTT